LGARKQSSAELGALPKVPGKMWDPHSTLCRARQSPTFGALPVKSIDTWEPSGLGWLLIENLAIASRPFG